MTDARGGGPAFPTTPYYHRDGDTQHFYAGHYGMTLRDYFAATALAALVSGQRTYQRIEQISEECGLTEEEVVGEWVYEYADAMLKAREK